MSSWTNYLSLIVRYEKLPRRIIVMYLHAVVECHEVGMFSRPVELYRICGHVAHVSMALLCTLMFLVVSSDCGVLGHSRSFLVER